MNKLVFSLFVSMAIFSMQASAATSSTPTSYGGYGGIETTKIDATKAVSDPDCDRYAANKTAAITKEINRLPKPDIDAHYKNFMSCIDSMKVGFGLNLDWLSLDALFRRIQDMACRAVMAEWREMVGNVNTTIGTSVELPGLGRVGGGSTSTGMGRGSGVSVNGSSVGLGDLSKSSAAASPSNKSVSQKASDLYKNVFGQ